MKKNILLITGGLLLINFLGYLLRTFELPAFIILLGFRFHLCAIFFLLVLFHFRREIEIKKQISNFSFQTSWRSLLTIVPTLILAAAAYFLKFIKFDEPEYFYELGLSSLVDFPIYFVWNLPQLILLFLFFNLISNLFRRKIIFLFSPFIFLFEILPLPGSEFYLLRSAEIFSASIFAVLLFIREKNIYVNSFVTFTTLWLIILLYGSGDAAMVKIFLASTYNSWEGFLKAINPYAIYLPLASILLACMVAFKKDNLL